MIEGIGLYIIGRHTYSGCEYVSVAKQTRRTKHPKHCCCAAMSNTSPTANHCRPGGRTLPRLTPSSKLHRRQHGSQTLALATTCKHASRDALHENVRSPTGIDPGQDIPRRMENHDALDGGHDVAPCDFHRGRLFPDSFIAVNAVQVHL